MSIGIGCERTQNSPAQRVKFHEDREMRRLWTLTVALLVVLLAAATARGEPPCSDERAECSACMLRKDTKLPSPHMHSQPFAIHTTRAGAKDGECEKNPHFMHASCKRSCDRCPSADADEPMMSEALQMQALVYSLGAILAAFVWVACQRRWRPSSSWQSEEQRAKLRDTRMRRFGSSESPSPAALPKRAHPTGQLAAASAEATADAPEAISARRAAALEPSVVAPPMPTTCSDGHSTRPQAPASPPRPSVRQALHAWAGQQPTGAGVTHSDHGGAPGVSGERRGRVQGRSWEKTFVGPLEALEGFLQGGRVLLLSAESNDAASLHLLRRVWPDPEVQSALSDASVLAARIDGGREATFWASELMGGGVLPSIAIIWGRWELKVIRERRLEPVYLTRHVQLAISKAAAAAAAATVSAAEDRASGGRARGEALLAAYRRAKERDFRPPTPPPTQAEVDRAILEEIDAAYAASLEADERADAEAEEKAAAAEAAAKAEAVRQEAAEASAAEREWAMAVAIAEREAALAARREERLTRAADVPPEPEPSDTTVASIAVRLSDGRRATRRFRSDTALRLVFSWLGGVAPDVSPFHLAVNYPRRVWTEATDGDRSLEELGLCPAATLLLIEEDDEAESVEPEED
jgi:hypothetical protein